MAALEKAKEEKQAQGEIEMHYPKYLGAQDTYYVGKAGRIYQQTFIDALIPDNLRGKWMCRSNI